MGRFVRPEAIEGTSRVTRVFDQVHVVHRACRTVGADEGNLDDVRDRLRRLSRVSHPNLAKLVAVGEEGGRLMVVSEWLPGGQLGRSHIPNPGRLLPGVAEALYALHRHGLAHGSVSPSSFLLDGNDQVKLVDACVREGSVPEDIEAFGRAMEALYAGRELPPELAQVARDAREGRFGDATLLAQAVAAVCAELPPVAGGDPTDVASPPRMTPPPPEEEDDDDERPLVFWLLLALLPAALLLWGALLAGWFLRGEPEVRQAPIELHRSAAPVPAPPAAEGVAEAAHEPPPAEGTPIEDHGSSGLGHTVVPMPAPYVEGMHAVTQPMAGGGDPTLFAHVRVDPPTPEPAAPEVPSTGAWRRSIVPGDTHPGLVLVLDATNSVEDRLGRKGRPRLEIRCVEHRLSASLSPGVAAVEVILNEVGFESSTARVIYTPGGREAQEEAMRLPNPDAPLMVFPNPGRWVNTMAATDTLDASYTPFASPSVVAHFETEGLPHLLGDIREYCKL